MSELRVQHTNNRDKLINALADMDETFTKLSIRGLDLAHEAAMRFMSKNKSAVSNERNSAWLDLSTAGSAAATMIAAGFQPEGAGKSFFNAVTQISQGIGSSGKTFLGSRTSQFNAEQSEAMQIQHQQFNELSREAASTSQKMRQLSLELLQKMYK